MGVFVSCLLRKGTRIHPGVVGNLFPARCRIEDDGCFLASDTGSKSGAATEDYSRIQVMVSFPGLLDDMGYLAKAGKSCFVLTANGGVDRHVAPNISPAASWWLPRRD